LLLFLLVIWIYVELAKLPGKKARERGHPQAEAISVLSWIGLLLGIVPWVIALVWAYTKPIAAGFSPTIPKAPEERVSDTASSVDDTEPAGSAPAT
jgi:hypothetical protein